MKCVCEWRGEERIDNKICSVHHPKKEKLKCLCDWENGKRLYNSECPVHKDNPIPSAEEQIIATRGMGESDVLKYAKNLVRKQKNNKPIDGCPVCTHSSLTRNKYMRDRKTRKPLVGKHIVKCKKCGTKKLLIFNDNGKIIDAKSIKEKDDKVSKV